MSRKNRPSGTQGNTSLKRSKLQNWLIQEGWQIGEVPPSELAEWVINATTPVGHAIWVAQWKTPPDLTMLEIKIGFDDEFRKRLAKLSQAKRRSLFYDIRLTLLQIGVDFDGLQDPLQVVTLIYRLYDEALTKQNFSQAVYKMKSAHLAVMWMIEKELEDSSMNLAAMAMPGSGSVH